MMAHRNPLRPRLANPNDARAVRSRAALRAALLELVADRSLESVTIKDMTARAGVSYPVFFRNHGSKDDILADIATEQVRELLALTTPIFYSEQGPASIRAMCDFVNQRRRLWRSLLHGGAATAMRIEFARIAAETGQTRARINQWLPPELAAPFVSGGLFEILSWWLKQADDYPIGNVVTLIEVLIVNATGRPLDIRLD